MKDLTVLILVTMAFFFVWNGMQTTPSTSYYAVEDTVQDQAVSPEITQAILAKALTMKPDVVPIDTVFINLGAGGTYDARISFFNKKYFYGVQYDLKAKVSPDGSVEILSFGDSPVVETNPGYIGGSYQSWKAVTDNLSKQFQGALQGYKNQPPQPNLTSIPAAYNSGMIETKTNLQTRA
jgi:hypothetical protein